MHDHDPQPWQCDDCGHINSPESPVCLCYFWDDETIREIDNWTERHREPAPDLSQWFTVSIQDQGEESRERWSNAQPCPQCGTPMLYQDELARGLCPMCWSKNRKEQ